MYNGFYTFKMYYTNVIYQKSSVDLIRAWRGQLFEYAAAEPQQPMRETPADGAAKPQ